MYSREDTSIEYYIHLYYVNKNKVKTSDEYEFAFVCVFFL